jgi:hypothetical protein
MISAPAWALHLRPLRQSPKSGQSRPMFPQNLVEGQQEETKVAQLAITFKNHTRDWFMSLAMNNPQGTPKTVVEMKKTQMNDFQRPSSKDQYVNKMIQIKNKPGESVWEVDQKFKRLKGKLEYPITNICHRQPFINSLFPHFKYPLRKHKF